MTQTTTVNGKNFHGVRTSHSLGKCMIPRVTHQLFVYITRRAAPCPDLCRDSPFLVNKSSVLCGGFLLGVFGILKSLEATEPETFFGSG